MMFGVYTGCGPADAIYLGLRNSACIVLVDQLLFFVCCGHAVHILPDDEALTASLLQCWSGLHEQVSPAQTHATPRRVSLITAASD